MVKIYVYILGVKTTYFISRNVWIFVQKTSFIFRETDIRPGLRDPEDQEEILTLTARKHPQQPTDFNGMMAPEPQVIQ